MYFKKKVKSIEYVIYRLFSSQELQELRGSSGAAPAASLRLGAITPPPESYTVHDFACILLNCLLIPDLRRVSLERDLS